MFEVSILLALKEEHVCGYVIVHENMFSSYENSNCFELVPRWFMLDCDSIDHFQTCIYTLKRWVFNVHFKLFTWSRRVWGCVVEVRISLYEFCMQKEGVRDQPRSPSTCRDAPLDMSTSPLPKNKKKEFYPRDTRHVEMSCSTCQAPLCQPNTLY